MSFSVYINGIIIVSYLNSHIFNKITGIIIATSNVMLSFILFTRQPIQQKMKALAYNYGLKQMIKKEFNLLQVVHNHEYDLIYESTKLTHATVWQTHQMQFAHEVTVVTVRHNYGFCYLLT